MEITAEIIILLLNYIIILIFIKYFSVCIFFIFIDFHEATARNHFDKCCTVQSFTNYVFEMTNRMDGTKRFHCGGKNEIIWVDGIDQLKVGTVLMCCDSLGIFFFLFQIIFDQSNSWFLISIHCAFVFVYNQYYYQLIIYL